jgi:hypothetical protein
VGRFDVTNADLLSFLLMSEAILNYAVSSIEIKIVVYMMNDKEREREGKRGKLGGDSEIHCI